MQITKEHKDIQITERVAERPLHGFLREFTALRSRNFRFFWSGQLISLIGTWMQTTGQAWLVLQITHSALALGIVGALQFLPILLFTLFGGVVADRLPKRRLLLFTQSFAALQAITLWLLVATGTVQLWHVYVLAFLLGLTNSLDMPARQSFIVEMVGQETLPNAIALNSSIFNMARIVGPGIAGLIIARLGEAPLFLLNSISFIPVLIGLTMIDISKLYGQQSRLGAKQNALQSVGEGLVYVWKTPVILLIIAVVGIVSLFGINFNVTLPLVATEVLNSGAEGYGFISSAFGLGALIAALWLAWGNRKPSITQILISAISFSVGLGLFGISHWYPLSIVLIALTGFAQITFTAVANTTLQTVTPNHLRGRIMSVYMLMFNGSTPIGNIFTGVLAHSFGISATLVVSAVLSLIAAIGGWIKRAPAIKDMERSRPVIHE